MKVSKILSLFAWFNVYALIWAMFVSPEIQENRWLLTFAWVIFAGVAVVASGIQGKDR